MDRWQETNGSQGVGGGTDPRYSAQRFDRSIEERRGCQLGDRELLPFQRKGEDGDVDFGGKATDADGPMLDGRIQDA